MALAGGGGGHAAAQDALGYLYDFGLGLPIDHDLAEYWYKKAVAGGDLNAKNNLAYAWINSGRRYDEALDLLRQVGWHGGSMSLVLRIQIVAEGFAFGIKHTRAIIRRKIGAQTAQHVEHTVDRTRRPALRTAQIGLRHGVKSAIQVG